MPPGQELEQRAITATDIVQRKRLAEITQLQQLNEAQLLRRGASPVDAARTGAVAGDLVRVVSLDPGMHRTQDVRLGLTDRADTRGCSRRIRSRRQAVPLPDGNDGNGNDYMLDRRVESRMPPGDEHPMIVAVQVMLVKHRQRVRRLEILLKGLHQPVMTVDPL